jgi:hypothetical protein
MKIILIVAGCMVGVLLINSQKSRLHWWFCDKRFRYSKIIINVGEEFKKTIPLLKVKKKKN